MKGNVGAHAFPPHFTVTSSEEASEDIEDIEEDEEQEDDTDEEDVLIEAESSLP